MLDPAARLAALMRSQVGALARKQPARPRASQPAGKAAAAAAQADVANLLAQRLQAIDRTDPRRGHKATRVYLESVMLAEFGFGLANDPAFTLMVDAVHEQMNGDPQLAGAMAEAAALLLGEAPR